LGPVVFAQTRASDPHELVNLDPIEGLVDAPGKALGSLEVSGILGLVVGFVESEPHDLLVAALVVVVESVVPDGLVRVVEFLHGEVECARNVLAVQMLGRLEVLFVAVL